ncbi:MAG: serine/threonine protein kinase [Betaproteobacteria bacterium]|nr:serine/threonine protein kinase [Betaproteobacteria bacterium]
MNASAHPFSALTPERILDAVEEAGIRCDGRLSALNSYENRVYQVGVDDGGFVVAKFYRPDRWSDAQILEEHGFLGELVADEVPVVAPIPLSGGATLARSGGFRLAVFPRRGGRAPEFDDETLRWIGRFIARIHQVGVRARHEHRDALTVQRLGRESRDFLCGRKLLPPDLEPAYRSVAEMALAAVDRAFEHAGPLRRLRLHGDCHPGNVLWTDDGPHFVDFDDTCQGPAVQDLWMLLSGDRETRESQLACVLEGYETFRDFDRTELLIVEALRTLRMMHYAAWLARRWDDPAFPVAFPWFGTQRYWQDHILELREQIAAMDEPPIGAV